MFFFFPFPVFKVENSENLLQVQTVFHPAEERGGECAHTHTHPTTHTHNYTVLNCTLRTFIEMMCLMS